MPKYKSLQLQAHNQISF